MLVSKNYTYTIEVDTNPHTWDNKYKPYFWSIWSIDAETGNRANSGSCGWAETVEAAWAEAYKTYQRCFIKAVKPTVVEPSDVIMSQLELTKLLQSCKRHKYTPDLHSFNCTTMDISAQNGGMWNNGRKKSNNL